MFENLNQPYSFNNNFKHNVRTISFVSMGFMLIVLYFQPFGINFLSSARNGYFVLIMGLISAGVLLFNTLFLPGLFPKLFESEKWTIKKELIWNTSMFIWLVAGFALAAYIFGIESFRNMSLFRSGALAVIPMLLFNLMNYNRSLKTKVTHMIDSGRHWLSEERNQQSASPKTEDKITIGSENGKDTFSGEVKNIILIHSASNYIEIFFRDGILVKRQLLRQTLTSAEKIMKGFPNMKKCHRSSLVNINQVNRVSGSYPNISLQVDGLDFLIPVSRQHFSYFRNLLITR